MPESPQTAAASPVAYSYIRFSTPEQRKGDSFRRQITRARTYAAEHGLHLDESLRDEGVSGFKGEHRQETAVLGAFLKRVEKGDIPRGSYLLVESLDRLSREEVVLALTSFLDLIKRGITIVTLGDSREYSMQSLRDNFTELLISIVVMSRAHEESATKSDRVGRAWAAKRDRARTAGQAMTARCPAWIRLVDGPKIGHYELIEERAAAIRGWFDKTISGNGRRTIARDLNTRGVATWGSGALWHDSYIQKVLSNPATYGAFAPRGKLAGGSDPAAQPIEGYFPAVVDETTFRKAQAISKARGAQHGSTSPKNHNLLRGLAKCEVCGSTMVFIDKGKRSYPTLKCGRAHQSAGCDNRRLYPYLTIEVTVIWGIGPKRADLLASAVDAQRAAEDAVVVAIGRRDEKKAMHERLIDLHVNGVGGLTERLRASGEELATLESDVVAAEAARDRARLLSPDVDIADLNKVYGDLAHLTAEETVAARAAMREKLGRMVDKVVIGPSGFVCHHRDGGKDYGSWGPTAPTPPQEHD